MKSLVQVFILCVGLRGLVCLVCGNFANVASLFKYIFDSSVSVHLYSIHFEVLALQN